jgi:cold shock CspA family protein
MPIGRVRHWNGEYGFLRVDATEGIYPDVFFYWRDVPKGTDVERGTILDFEIATQKDGRLRAVAIKVA